MQTLVNALVEEDALLRQLLASFPRSCRESEISPGSLSCKAALGHIAFWDDFTVRFFLSQVRPDSFRMPPPGDFESASNEAQVAMDRLPYGDVLARYLESTGALLDFLKAHWQDLSEKGKNDFWIPLKHRRHHRLALEEDLERLNRGRIPDQGSEFSAQA